MYEQQYIPSDDPGVLDNDGKVTGPLVVQAKVLGEGLGTEQLESLLNKVPGGKK